MNCIKNEIILAFLVSAISFGQPASSSTVQSVFNAYWSTGEGYKCVAELHNNLPKQPLSVLPVVYTSDGAQISLDAVNLSALGNASIDISAELASKGWANPSSGSIVFQYQRKVGGALTAEVYGGNSAESISFTIPSTPKPPASATQDAVFWLPSSSAGVYVSLQNTSNQQIHVTPSLTANGQTVTIPPSLLEPNGSTVLWFSKSTQGLASAWQAGASGGITVVQDGPPGALNTGGWIEDDSSGYSTTLTFADPTKPGASLIGTQILVGDAAGLLGFSAPFPISAQMVLRNMSGQPVNVQGTLTFTNNGTLANASIASIQIPAGGVKSVDLDQVKAQASVPAAYVAGSIALQYSGSSGALMGRVFGTTPGNAYGFYWALQPSAGSTYSESYWTTSGNWTPLLTIGNFAASSDTVKVVLTSNAGTFNLPPITLQPMESRTIDVRDLIETQQPFPPSVNSGGYRIYGASSSSKLIVKEHLVDPVAQLATPFYGDYLYFTAIFFYQTEAQLESGGLSPVPAGVDNGASLVVGGLYDDDTYTGVCPYDSESYNTSIVTLSFDGCYGTVTGGSSVGSTYLSADADVIIDEEGDDGDLGTGYVEEATLPTVSLTVSTTTLTISKQNGNAQFYVSASASGGFTGTIAGSMTVSAPAGATGITFTQGGSPQTFDFTLGPGGTTSSTCSTPTTDCYMIVTSMSNSGTGSPVWTITVDPFAAYVTNSTSPKQVTGTVM